MEKEKVIADIHTVLELPLYPLLSLPMMELFFGITERVSSVL